jgi:hypothetical protein
MNDCPSTTDGKHRFTYSVGSGIKSDFEPVDYGKSVDETFYRRVTYSVLACLCGKVRMSRVKYEDDL